MFLGEDSSQGLFVVLDNLNGEFNLLVLVVMRNFSLQLQENLIRTSQKKHQNYLIFISTNGDSSLCGFASINNQLLEEQFNWADRHDG